MPKPKRLSYFVIFTLLVLVVWLRLGTPLVTILFSYFALTRLHWVRRKPVAVALFILIVLGVFYGFGWFIRQAIVALPKIASTTIPSIIDYAQAHGLTLPFDDWDSLKALVLDTVKDQLRSVGSFARIASKEFAFVAVGIVVAIGLFLNPRMDIDPGVYRARPNLYAALSEELTARFRAFYLSFATVMGGQLIISAINTVLTAIFVLSISLPYAPVVIGVTFLAGLLPIVGGLISNAIIVGIAFTQSPRLAVAALVFLIVVHKLEYFLNSKIIGHRINNPVWLTLLALVIGERLMGIPGMVLAPVIVNYLKNEAAEVPLGAGESGTVGE